MLSLVDFYLKKKIALNNYFYILNFTNKIIMGFVFSFILKVTCIVFLILPLGLQSRKYLLPVPGLKKFVHPLSK